MHDQLYHGDNLAIMRGMEASSVDLIYADPPFGTGQDWGTFVDKRTGDEYLDWIEPRLTEMRRVLTTTGSIYLHCDPTMSHYLKVLMDSVFGRVNFRNEIIWKRTFSHNRAKRWGPIHDTVLFYAGKGFSWNRMLQPLGDAYVEKYYRHRDKHGRYQNTSLTGPGYRTGDTGRPWHGIDPSSNSRHWELPPDRALPDWFVFPAGYPSMSARERLDVLDEQGLIYWPSRGSMPRFKRYLTERSGGPVADIVLDIPPLSHAAKERLGYQTQKPLALLERIILASSNPGDVVLDPFCGSGTALVAAARAGRRWIGIDQSAEAIRIASERTGYRGLRLKRRQYRLTVT